ncbi:carbohydrate-binding module family 50 protein, partial [Macrolepiota fuliginosa MF-IS2]
FNLGVRAQDDECNRPFYYVQSGDTCDRIGKAQNAPSWQIRFENSDFIDVTCSNLYPGEQLCLGVVGRDCQKVYVVKSGDTCASIAAAYGLTADGFIHANWRAVDQDCSIYAGEV